MTKSLPTHESRSDEQRLHELGYAQELRRTMSGFSNFAVSFTIISILSGIWWLVPARKWFKGPKVQGSEEELAAIERELQLEA
jgi:hypothetical protein